MTNDRVHIADKPVVFIVDAVENLVLAVQIARERWIKKWISIDDRGHGRAPDDACRYPLRGAKLLFPTSRAIAEVKATSACLPAPLRLSYIMFALERKGPMTAPGTFETSTDVRSTAAFDAVDGCAGRPAEGRRCESVTVKA
jgi:hypothetical protein